MEEQPAAPEPIEAEGYSKIGPGPMAAIRFRWTVRREANDEYYVDETIGENSAPVVSGPLAPDEAIRLVDDRESEARERFEQIRSEMTGRAAAANLVRKDAAKCDLSGSPDAMPATEIDRVRRRQLNWLLKHRIEPNLLAHDS